MKGLYKLISLLLFVLLLVLSSVLLYNTYVKDKPPIRIEENRTDYDRLKADSLIKNSEGFRK